MRIIGALDARTGRVTPTIVPMFTTSPKDHTMTHKPAAKTVTDIPAVATDVLDAARAIARLDAVTGLAPSDRVILDGTEWTGTEILTAVSRNLLHRMRISLTGTNTYGVPLSTVTAMLAALGGSQHLINVHGQQIAKLMRKDWRNGS